MAARRLCIVCATLLVLTIGSVAALHSNAEPYAGFQILSVSVEHKFQAEALMAMIETSEVNNWDLRLWNDRPTVPGTWDFQVPRDAVTRFKSAVVALELQSSVLHEDLGRDIDLQMRSIAAKSSRANFFSEYATYDEMNAFMLRLVGQHVMADFVQVGKTLNGNNITGVHICSSRDCSGKPAIVFNGGQHAREWLSPMTVAFILDNLLSNYTTDASVKKIVDAFDWTIIPIVNVDGYLYTWSDDRMWRKNRRVNDGSPCDGVDINRNWDYEWGGPGASPVDCSDTYFGTAGFSEPEETAVANMISNIGSVEFYIDFHMYGNLFMYPWGYTCDKDTADAAVQQSMADEYQTAVQAVHGEYFTTGAVCQTIYVASGGSNDWTYGAADAVYSYAVELRGSTFLAPPEDIVLSGQEQFAGILASAQFVMANPKPPSSVF